MDYNIYTMFKMKLFFLYSSMFYVSLIGNTCNDHTHILISSFRGYLQRMFMEDVPSFKFGVLAWLFLGAANTDSILYHDEFTKYTK